MRNARSCGSLRLCDDQHTPKGTPQGLPIEVVLKPLNAEARRHRCRCPERWRLAERQKARRFCAARPFYRVPQDSLDRRTAKAMTTKVGRAMSFNVLRDQRERWPREAGFDCRMPWFACRATMFQPPHFDLA